MADLDSPIYPVVTTPAGAFYFFGYDSGGTDPGNRITDASLKVLFQSVANTAGKATQRDTDGSIDVGALNLDTTATPTTQEGQIRWNATDKCAEVVQDGGVIVQVGQEVTVRARNTTGSTLANGTPVYVNGATGNRPTIARADADAFPTASTLIGLVTDSAGIANNADGHVTVFGMVRDLNTSAYSDGATLYLSDGTSGTLTATKPTAIGSFVVRVGYVTRSHASQGVILVSPQYLGSVTGDAVVNATSQAAARTAIDAPKTDLSDTAAQSAISRFSRASDFMDAAYAPMPADDIPIITQATGAEPAIASPVVYRPYICNTGVQVTNSDGQGDTIIRFAPGTFFTSGGGSSDLFMYGTIKPGGDAQFARWPIIATIITSASNSVIEFCFFSLVDNNQVMPLIEVGGRLLSDSVAQRTVSGSGWKINLTFPTAKSRRITIYAGGEIGLYKIAVPATQSISKPTDTINKLVAVIGDSYANGAGIGFLGGAGIFETFAFRFARFIGADSLLLAGIGGTGFVQGGATNAYYTRVSYVLGKNPNVLVVNGSINDGTTAGTIEASVASFLASVSSITTVYVIGTMVAQYEANHDAVRAATLAAGRTFIDMRSFFTGTGNIASKVGDGNNDFYRWTDNVHPSTEGHRGAARNAYRQIAQ